MKNQHNSSLESVRNWEYDFLSMAPLGGRVGREGEDMDVGGDGSDDAFSSDDVRVQTMTGHIVP